jgi:hypothetical protein
LAAKLDVCRKLIPAHLSTDAESSVNAINSVTKITSGASKHSKNDKVVELVQLGSWQAGDTHYPA